MVFSLYLFIVLLDLLVVFLRGSNYAGYEYGWLFPLLSKWAKPKNEVRFIRLANACLTCDTYGKLHRIICPTLVLGGADDKIVTGMASLEIAEKIGCEVHMYEGLGHSAYEEAADFNQRIQRFLDECD